MLLKRLLRIPWVAEFRDPWRPVRRPIRKHLERWLQGIMVRSADAVVVHSKGYGAELQQSYGIPGGKLAVVSNGFDEEDFGPGEDGKGVVLPAGVLHMSHFGTIYPSRSGKFFSALAELIQECPEVKKRIRVNIIGFPDDEALRFAGDRDMKDVLQFRPFMPHDGSLRAMAASHCLLLFWGDRDYSRLTVAGKLYEYLRVGRPILALDHGGETAELIEAAKAGRVIPPDDTERIKQALREFLNQNPNEPSGGPARPDFVAQFRYDRLAGRLAGVLDEVSRHDR
jgi:glycosyltransferase involved in cell wall biosynthesis